MIVFTELTKLTVPRLWKQRSDFFSADVVNLGGVKIDSAGVAFLVRWTKSLKKGRKLKLINADEDLLKLISVFRIADLFDCEQR